MLGRASHGLERMVAAYTRARSSRAPGFLFKQIRVRAGASKEDGFVRNIIDKQPVCFDVAFPKTIPFAAEFVRACGCGERFIALQTNKDSAQFPKVDPAFRHSFFVA